MINVGHMAKTYGLLPSEVIARATTYDIMVTDVYTTWQNHKAQPNDLNNLDTDQLQAMVNKTRENNE